MYMELEYSSIKEVRNLAEQQKKVIDGLYLKNMFISGANNLENNKEMVNSLNVFPVPDGDTGTNMSLTMTSAIKEINNAKDNNASTIAELAANGSLMGARGNSGVILSQILRGFAKALKNEKQIDSKTLANALMEGSKTAYKAVMRPTEGTILTVIRESAEHGIMIADKTTDLPRFLEEVVNQANKTLEKTPDMLPVLKQANVVDAGGKGLVNIFNGMLFYLTTNRVIQATERVIQFESVKEKPGFKAEDIEFGYCTEFFIKGEALNHEFYKNAILGLGDSLIVVGDENLIKVHIHTNNPGLVLEKALELGRLSSIKIDNMREQHRELLINEEDKLNYKKKIGIVAVAVGSGITSIFKDLGADEIIEGGQTMNPSTEDILSSINKVNADNIIILPNNGNIILAAKQVKYLTSKNIMVAQTKTIPQGVAAIMAVDQDKALNENVLKIQHAINGVKTGLITYAVRDSNFNGVDIEEGNIIGIIESEIESVGNNIREVATKVMELMVDGDSSLITLYYGDEVDLKEAELLFDDIKDKYGECDVELHFGGQQLYYYIISVE